MWTRQRGGAEFQNEEWRSFETWELEFRINAWMCNFYGAAANMKFCHLIKKRKIQMFSIRVWWQIRKFKSDQTDKLMANLSRTTTKVQC